MSCIPTIGFDLAKNVFQVHGVAACGQVRVRRQLRRGEVLRFFESLPPRLVGMEACSSSHFWAREMDAADAEAICEAVTRPSMRFVSVKTADQQAVLMLHKTRELLVRQRTMLTNALRCHLAEYGIIAAQGMAGVDKLLMILGESEDRLPADALAALAGLTVQLSSAETEIEKLEARIMEWHRHDAASRRLVTIPDVGPITASAISASVADASLFHSGRQFAAWLGLTPRANSSGGKDRLMGISKQGDGYLRRLLVVGATAVLRHARKGNPGKQWAMRLLER